MSSLRLFAPVVRRAATSRSVVARRSYSSLSAEERESFTNGFSAASHVEPTSVEGFAVIGGVGLVVAGFIFVSRVKSHCKHTNLYAEGGHH